MAVSKKNKAIYNMIFDGIEQKAANIISNYQEKKYLKKYKPKEKMPKEYKKKYKAFWSKYGRFSAKWGWYYASRNGNYDVRYIPNTLYYTKIDQYFNSRKLGWGFNDKNYYNKIFNGIPQPTTIIHKFNKILTDKDYNLITFKEAIDLIMEYSEVICKPSQETGSGRGIIFLKCSNRKDVEDFLNNPNNDNYIVQKLITQNKKLNEIHPNSINSIRICSLLLEDGVHILSSCLRMGVGDNRVDNVTAGGISVGIDKNGILKENAYTYYSGEKLKKHPTTLIEFKGIKIPGYENAVKLVKKAHSIIGHFQLVSWDIAIDEDDEAILIEANMRKGGINLHQFDNGPLFGDMTEKILDIIYKRK